MDNPILSSLSEQELKEAFASEAIAAKIFEADVNDPQQMYYCLGEVAYEWVNRSQDSAPFITSMGDFSDLQKAASLDALASVGYWQAIEVAEMGLRSSEGVLKRASVNYLFKSHVNQLAKLVSICKSDTDPLVRVGLAMRLFDAFRQSLSWLEDGLGWMSTDVSEMVRSQPSDELGTLEHKDCLRVLKWMEDSNLTLEDE